MNKKNAAIIFGVIAIFTILYAAYPFLDTKLEGYLINYEIAFIERVIDGDTVESNGTSIRLLGINTPEKGEVYYSEAKEFLEDLVLNKTVRLEFGKDREDKYGRTLAYLYIREENINLKLIEEGYANFYFPSGRDMHYNDFKQNWEDCDLNLCEISNGKCASCIKLTKFDYEEEVVIFENICNFECELTDWEIKDEGRKKFVFEKFVLESSEEIEITNEDFGQDYVWTRSGDTLFLRDNLGKLVLWESY